MENWFVEEEKNALKFSYKFKEILYTCKSKYQEISILDTVEYGRMLTIDNVVMTTECDEFVYHEMISHIPVCLHGGSGPKKVLIIGGGDGGVIRELLRHDDIEKIILCEIDEKVIEVSRKYLPQISSSLDDKRVKINIGDGIDYIKNHRPNDIDIIIVDSTDPIGPGEVLFSPNFYEGVKRALKKDGLMVAQTESPWREKEFFQKIQTNISKAFPYLKPYLATVPTYPRSLWSWTLASSQKIDLNNFNKKKLIKIEGDLNYLNTEIFSASFALPTFLKKTLSSINGIC